jgi:peroxiredoxin
MNRPIAILLACILTMCLCFPAGAGQPKVGDRAPDFSLRDLESNLIRLSDIAYKGKEKSWKKKKDVLLDFFRTDCKPCMKKLPEVVAFYNKNKAKVQVILIALLESENGRAKLDGFLKANKLPFPVLVDSYETVAKKYIVDDETLTLPSIFYIDKNGVIRAFFQEMKGDLETSITKALKAEPGKKKKSK